MENNKLRLLHHNYRGLLDFKWNIKILTCRFFGHQLNNNIDYKWCQRCGLAYEEIYYKQLKTK